MAPHSSTLAWKIPWMEEPGRLQSMGSLRVRHDWATSLSLFTFMHWRRKWQPTPVFLPGESQGRGNLVGCCLWGRAESDTTEATQQQQQQHHPLFYTEKIYCRLNNTEKRDLCCDSLNHTENISWTYIFCKKRAIMTTYFSGHELWILNESPRSLKYNIVCFLLNILTGVTETVI